MKKEERKKLSFVVFVMAIFFAGVVLAKFSSYSWLMVFAGVLLFASACFFAWSRGDEKESPSEKTSEILLADRMAELIRSNERAEKGVYIAVKKQHEAMEEGISALDASLKELGKLQEEAVKTMVRYNKENARQLALSEREELQHLGKELQENCEAALAELASTTDYMEELKNLLSELVHSNVHEKFDNLVNELPRVPLEAVISPGKMEKDEPEQIEPEMMMELIPDEPETEEPVSIEEPKSVSAPVEEKTEPQAAATESGVDLSDPNRTLSADDIAALIASMGN